MGGQLAQFLQQYMIWGYAASDVGDIAAATAEQRHLSPSHRPPTVDVLCRPLWDEPEGIDVIVVMDGRRHAIPYWHALPGLVEAILFGTVVDRRNYVRGA